MALIEWDNNFSVNVKEIDLQHQNLIAIINELNDAMKQGKSAEIMEGILDSLLTYGANHFKFEEDNFDRFGYLQAVLHKKEHTEFVKKVKNFKDEMHAKKIGLSIEVMKFLGHWLTNHIKMTDKQYTAFFNEHGLV